MTQMYFATAEIPDPPARFSARRSGMTVKMGILINYKKYFAFIRMVFAFIRIVIRVLQIFTLPYFFSNPNYHIHYC